ncbi:Crp/Fnr family transcriptional regulator [Polluticoccus soli]|uniref:Crp/Fnr family transcriptional regulator n=1 Tax=Polluticoccus soli TaxID=3034150 RepID=UPI0023E186A7|nr:Crp/Fnr family transcriptional regulator [Flavipsychrobacter sp. JY13-12]
MDTSVFKEEIKKRISVSNEEIERFLHLWEVREFKRNELILKAGVIPKFSIFVIKGCLRQFFVNDEGAESIVYFAEERHFIGDLPALRNKVSSDFNFQAIEPCVLLTISSENWERSFQLFPWWAEAHIKGYQKWATLMQQQMADMQLRSGEERYLDLLKKRPGLFQRVPQHFIASYLGLSPESLSRIRKKLASG